MRFARGLNTISAYFLAFLLSSCASSYVLPRHPMLSPEVTGKPFGIEAEVESDSAKKASIDLSNNNATNPLLYSSTSDLNYLAGIGLSSRMDVFWDYAQNAIPMFGVQVELDPSAVKKLIPNHKGFRASITGAYGLSRNQMNGSVDLNYHSNVEDFALITGYRLNSNLLFYDSISYTRYEFESTVQSSNTSLNGLEPNYTTNSIAISLGVVCSLSIFDLKGALEYESIRSTDTPNASDFGLRLSAGVHF